MIFCYYHDISQYQTSRYRYFAIIMIFWYYHDISKYQTSLHLKTRYCPLSIARCDLLAAIFVMLKILRLLFVARIELFNNNGTPRSRENQNNNKGTQSITANTGPLRRIYRACVSCCVYHHIAQYLWHQTLRKSEIFTEFRLKSLYNPWMLL